MALSINGAIAATSLACILPPLLYIKIDQMNGGKYD